MLLAKSNDNIIAVLGPTNTGKTYYAFERLLSYKSGIFGFPLRLLARENYDKAIKKVGINKVALITGEEKIYPKNASYFFCTVESMPLNIEVECIAIDEIQLSSDYERGYIFTDRILNSRGSLETIFLGSLTIKNILKKIFSKIKIETRDRYSKLSFFKKESLSKIKARSAIIAFNINKVYEIAEAMRIHKGGAALVTGSLSPRTRNAQVDMYENKKVDYLIATDAIGMGLNLNINHVSFSSFKKYDGRYSRNLLPAEVGQIAGRAGRYQNDGTFGYTQDAGDLDPVIIKKIEEHDFETINKIYWRNSEIDFHSVNTVLNSLKEFPVYDYFIHKKNAEDELNFRALSNDPEIKQYLTNSISIQCLWDVCRIPDFQKIMNDTYLDLLKNIFLTLTKNDNLIPESWLNEKIIGLENYSGGIDELTFKIANIRTWTYISNQSNWIKNNLDWQEKTRNIEDNLSDHLHERLTNRFVDFSASYFLNSKNDNQKPVIKVDKNNLLILNDKKYGYINGFELKFFKISKINSLFLYKHAKRFIRSMIEKKIEDFLNAPLDSINLGDIQKVKLNELPHIYWGDEKVGYLIKGENIYSPKVDIINSEFIDSEKKALILEKLQKWIDNEVSINLKPIKDKFDDSVPSTTRSIAFNLYNFLGTMLIEGFQNEIKNIDQKNKLALSKLGIRVGAKFFFYAKYLKKNAMELNAILWRSFNNFSEKKEYPLPKDGRVSFSTDFSMPTSYWLAIGYIYIKDICIRVDVFERIFFLARHKLKTGTFIESADLMNPIGCNSDELANILSYCGIESLMLGNEKRLFYLKQKNQKISKKTQKIEKKKIPVKKKLNLSKKKMIKADPNSPFAVLQKLL
ncbi:MAG: hypothetical protein CFH17_00149 [Alphaproteobacteria bacterium MarineAlpha5_Bin7]|nr:MAG: hypothetical protein CFH17_00149 [Alphaproteobacteria bacterium MarineAlpha5_Bin7]